MSKTVRWILISVGVVAVLALLAALAFGMGTRWQRMSSFSGPTWGHPMMDQDWGRPGFDGPRDFGRGRMYDNYGRSMMNSRMGAWGMLGGGLFMLGRLVIPLALLGLAVWGVVALVRRGRQPAAVPAPAPVESVSTAVCGQCSKPVQEGWSHCPYCGNSL